MKKISKEMIDAYICGSEGALASGGGLERGMFKLGIAHQALAGWLPVSAPDQSWWDSTQARILRVLEDYEAAGMITRSTMGRCDHPKIECPDCHTEGCPDCERCDCEVGS